VKRITVLACALLSMVVIHDLDHVRQHRALGNELYGIGLVALVTALVTLVLALRGHSLAPAAAVVVGAGNVIGLAAVHVLPHWSAFSDPYPAAHVDALSWTVLAVMWMVAAALAFAGAHGPVHATS
jgi:hypothetical protein